MKSAYELAMERLEKSAPTQKLTASQKKEISDLESLYRSKIAEREVFLQGEIAKVNGDRDELDMLRKQLASEVRRLEEELESKKAKVREE